MFSLNGLDLHAPDLRGWGLERSSTFTAGTTVNRPELSIPGFDGAPEMDGVEEVPALSLVLTTTKNRLPAVRTLFRTTPLVLGLKGTDRTGTVQLRSLSEEPVGVGDNPAYLVTAALILPGVWLRGTETTTATPLDAATKTAPVWPGLTGKVSDLTVRVQGPARGLKITDTAGSFLAYDGEIPTGTFLRFDATTGRAWLTQTDVWSGGIEVTGNVRTGPGTYPLRVTPSWTTDPGDTRGRLTVTTTARGATTAIEVKGRPAYVL